MTEREALTAALQAMSDDMVAADKLDVIAGAMDTMSLQIDLTNALISGVILFMGMLFGLLLIKILWERFK